MEKIKRRHGRNAPTPSDEAADELREVSTTENAFEGEDEPESDFAREAEETTPELGSEDDEILEQGLRIIEPGRGTIAGGQRVTEKMLASEMEDEIDYRLRDEAGAETSATAIPRQLRRAPGEAPPLGRGTSKRRRTRAPRRTKVGRRAGRARRAANH